jgi:hypothetical protein
MAPVSGRLFTEDLLGVPPGPGRQGWTTNVALDLRETETVQNGRPSEIAPGVRLTGNPLVDAISRLSLRLGGLLFRDKRPRDKSPEAMVDQDLFEAVYRLAIDLSQGTRLILYCHDRRTVDDPSWHRMWPTTVEMFCSKRLHDLPNATMSASSVQRTRPAGRGTGCL